MLHKMIKGFEDYLISDTGKVYSLKSQKYLKAMKNSSGYYQVCLYENNKHKLLLVHCLVAQAFIPNPENKPTVDHVNRIRSDNRVENLRWATTNEQLENRDLSNYANKQRKIFGTPIIEIVDNEQIKYDSLRTVPNMNIRSLQNHIYKGETDFYVKQLSGNVRHFIVPEKKGK